MLQLLVNSRKSRSNFCTTVGECQENQKETLSRKLLVGEGREKERIFSFKLAHLMNLTQLTRNILFLFNSASYLLLHCFNLECEIPSPCEKGALGIFLAILQAESTGNLTREFVPATLPSTFHSRKNIQSKSKYHLLPTEPC